MTDDASEWSKDHDKLARVIPLSTNPPNKWIGRIAIFELSTGRSVQGKILALNDDWIDTDSGAIRVAHIVHAKWVSEEEASIIRGGPLGSSGYSLSGREPNQFPRR
jgi:hypothetical protein